MIMLIWLFALVESKLYHISPSTKPTLRLALVEERGIPEVVLSDVSGINHDHYNDVVSMEGNPTELNFEYNNVCGSKNTTLVKSCIFQRKYFMFEMLKVGDEVKFMTDGKRCLQLGSRFNEDLYVLELDICVNNSDKQLFSLEEVQKEEESEDENYKKREHIPAMYKINRLISSHDIY